MRPLLISFLAWLGAVTTAHAAAPAKDLRPLVQLLKDSEVELKGVPFADVVLAATGKRVLPLTPTNAVDRALLAKLGGALTVVQERMNEPTSPAHQQPRINEVSAHFEAALKVALNAVPGFVCDFPKTTAGKIQRSGYPDLRLTDQASGRTVYLDPKLLEQKSRGSSLRTFYFEPKDNTNKIQEDAHHLIVGFSHAGRQADGRWQFVSWELVDLAHFRVQLKAEFQAGNRELYRPEGIVLKSR